MSDAQSKLRERARLFQAQIKKRAATAAGSTSTDTQTTPAVLTAASATASQPASTYASVANGVDANGDVSQPVSLRASASHKRDASLHDDVDDSATKKQRLSMEGNAAVSSSSSSSSSSVDPLDAFMSGLAGSMTDEERRALVGDTARQQSEHTAAAPAAPAASPAARTEQKEANAPPRSSPAAASSLSSASPDLERYFGDEEGAFDEDELDGLSRSESDSLLSAASRVKRKELKAVDHGAMQYLPIRKDFWIPSRDIAALSQQEVDELRRERLEGVKIRGKNCPRPFLEWSQCGLSAKLLDVIAQSGYSKPFPIQSQAIPVIMSGRDCIACAKTGSGKHTGTTAARLPRLSARTQSAAHFCSALCRCCR
jgi:ATP-dependent RNA helicase DDX46/PRP5